MPTNFFIMSYAQTTSIDQIYSLPLALNPPKQETPSHAKQNKTYQDAKERKKPNSVLFIPAANSFTHLCLNVYAMPCYCHFHCLSLSLSSLYSAQSKATLRILKRQEEAT